MSLGEINEPRVIEAMEKIRYFHTSKDSVAEYEKEDMIDAYADSCKVVNYGGAKRCAETLAGLLDEKNALVLDLAAGTGLVGQQLNQKGFRNLHAHDGSANMLGRCKLTGCYKKYIQQLLGGKHKLNIPDNTYSAVVMAGGVCPSHVPGDCQDEIVRILKPGGYFINTYRAEMINLSVGQDWTTNAERLEADGQWAFCQRIRFPKLTVVLEGVEDIYRKSE